MTECSFLFKNKHTCEAVVLTCVDFRFWNSVVEFVKNELKIKNFDLATVPGAAKEIVNGNEAIDKLEIDIPVKFHHVRKVVIVNHEDCGAYGGSSRFKNADEEEKFHRGELLKARSIIEKVHPGVEVVLAYARLVDEKKKIRFLIV